MITKPLQIGPTGFQIKRNGFQIGLTGKTVETLLRDLDNLVSWLKMEIQLSVKGPKGPKRFVSPREFFGILGQAYVNAVNNRDLVEKALAKANAQVLDAALMGEDRLYRK